MAFLFDWREAVAGDQGPTSPTTRHVLLTLSLHMDMTGGRCFPSTATLAERTALSERSVCTHLDRAESEGWIRRARKRGQGRAWAGTEYTAILPEALKEVQHLREEGTERGSAPRPEMLEGTEGGSVPKARGTEPHDIEALKEVQSNSSVNSAAEGAVEAFLAVTGMDWQLRTPVAEWVASLAGDYPGVRIAYEIRKAAEFHEGNPNGYKRPDRTIRNWLERAKSSTNDRAAGPLVMTPEEVREWSD